MMYRESTGSTTVRLLLLSTTLVVLAGCQPDPSSYQPNFVFILVDDLGFMDIGANNPDTFYETPNIDRLAGSGTRFTQGYAACPVCSPTRASIVTGVYPARLRTTDWFGAPQPEAVLGRENYDRLLLPAHYEDQLPLDRTTIAEALKDAGYATFFAGKWHLGTEGSYPEDHGFDVNQGGWERGGPYGGKQYFSPYGNPRLKDGPDGEHLPARLAEETRRFILDHTKQPFLAYLSFYSVHTPLLARPDLEEKYERKRATVPEEVWGVEGERRVRQTQNHAVYAGMVEAMDEAVGSVMNALEEAGLTENTVVFFMSDNGGLSTSEGHPTSNLPLRGGKGWLYEGGIREPMIVRWPGVTAPGSLLEEPVISTDFFPTILEMAGLPLLPEQHIDGISLAPLLKTGSAPDRNAIFWHYPHYGNQGGSPGAAVRSGNWKLILFFEDDHVELYNLADDIGEQRDFAATNTAKATELEEMLRAWLEETGAVLPTPNPRLTQ